jgi:glutaredoxin 3
MTDLAESGSLRERAAGDVAAASKSGHPGVMANKRRVEVFSAGCPLCHQVIDVVMREAGSSFEIIVRKMTDARDFGRATTLGIRSVPAVVIDGKLASCCAGNRGVDIQLLKDELKKAAPFH